MFSLFFCYIKVMDNFIDRLEWVLDQKGITKKKLSEDLNIRRETLSVWKKTDGMPRADVAMAIAVYLDISNDWLVTGIEKAPEEYDLLTKQVIKMFNQLTDKEKQTVLLILESLCKKEKEPDEDFKKVYG